MPEHAQLTIHTDGASRGNPGEAAFAYVIARDGYPPIENGGRLGLMTNNQAEYTALVKALEHALRLGAGHHLLVHSDSELMVKQMRGEYKVKNADLRDLYEEARDLAGAFRGGVTFHHVRREHNKRADELCNQALDGTIEPVGLDDELIGAKPAAPKAAVSSLEAEALACLRLAGARPSPEAVWQQLAALLNKHGLKLPRR